MKGKDDPLSKDKKTKPNRNNYKSNNYEFLALHRYFDISVNLSGKFSNNLIN